MRGLASFVVVFMLVFVITNSTVFAFAVEASGQVTVSASVAAIHSVFINSDGRIVKIISNTRGDAAIKVFLSDKPASQVPLTTGVFSRYQQISKTHDLRSIGEVYKQSRAAEVPVGNCVALSLVSNRLYGGGNYGHDHAISCHHVSHFYTPERRSQ